MESDVHALSWADVQVLAKGLAAAVREDGPPQVIVGIARGGLIPAVVIAHGLGVRDLPTVTVTHTRTDEVNAAKTSEPIVAARAAPLGDLSGKDVLLVDDIAGTGDTLAATRALVAVGGPLRLRTAVLWLNAANWRTDNADPTYVGQQDRGWVVFPWER